METTRSPRVCQDDRESGMPRHEMSGKPLPRPLSLPVLPEIPPANVSGQMTDLQSAVEPKWPEYSESGCKRGRRPSAETSAARVQAAKTPWRHMRFATRRQMEPPRSLSTVCGPDGAAVARTRYRRCGSAAYPIRSYDHSLPCPVVQLWLLNAFSVAVRGSTPYFYLIGLHRTTGLGSR